VQPQQPLIKVLSIDGGGIKGIIPATVLDYIEKRTGRPTSALFDLIAGTSTGGVLALGATKPRPDGAPAYSAEDGIALYVEEGPRIFSRPFWRKFPGWRLIEERYASGPIDEVLLRYFGDTRLNEALTDVIITSYDIEGRAPFFFKSRHAKDPTRPNDNFLMRDAARATAAAPTYFEPAKITTVTGDPPYVALIDGGVYAINPAMCAYAEVRHVYPPDSQMLLVSLGTGECTDPLPYDQVKGWGEASWARPILDVAFDGNSDTVDFQLRQLLPPDAALPRYYRFQTKLVGASDSMDDVSQKNLQALQDLGARLVADNQSALDELCGQLLGESG
jgi:patatin-like phospholipase/acyl hydrolase